MWWVWQILAVVIATIIFLFFMMLVAVVFDNRIRQDVLKALPFIRAEQQ